MAGTNTRSRKAAAPAEPAVEEPTTAVAARGETGVAVSEMDEFLNDTNLADDGTRDIAPRFPELKLIQGVTRLKDSSRHLGKWYHSGNEEFYDTIQVVPLHRQPQRAFFEQDGLQPICVAPDGIAPLPGQPLWKRATITPRGQAERPVPTVVPKTCAECPFSSFGANGERPECNKSELLMVLFTEGDEDNSFARLRLGGSAQGPFLREIADKHQYRGRRLPLYARTYTFSSEERIDGSRKWQQPVFESDQLSIGQMRQLNEVARMMAKDIRVAANEAVMDNYDDGYTAPTGGPVIEGEAWSNDGPAPEDDFEDVQF